VNAGFGVLSGQGKGGSGPRLISRAYELALELVDKTALTSSQFRNYFGELRSLENRFERERREDEDLAFARLVPQLELLKAKLYYNTRSNGPLSRARAFVRFLEEAIDAGSGVPRTLKP
jgi:CRISPR-associated protein Csm2